MSRHVCPVLIETGLERFPAGINASSKADPADVSLALRDEGWSPYRIWFDARADAWVAVVIYRFDRPLSQRDH
jgi:hypothetical protein